MQDLTEQFGELYKLTQNRVQAIVTKYVRSVDDADDLRQKIFLEFLVRHGDRPVDWGRDPRLIYLMARRRAVNHVRTLSNSKETSSSTAEFESRESDQNELRADVESALNQLAPKYQDIIRLTIYDDLSLRQIAKLQKISFGAAQRRLDKGKTLLLAELRNAGVIE